MENFVTTMGAMHKKQIKAIRIDNIFPEYQQGGLPVRDEQAIRARRREMLKIIVPDFKGGDVDEVLSSITINILLEENRDKWRKNIEKMAGVEVKSEQIDGQSGEELGYQEETKDQQ
jgi:hypothetical protein